MCWQLNNSCIEDVTMTLLEGSGRIVSLQLCPGHRKPMIVVEEAEAIVNLGLKDDKHALPDSSRQVLLIEEETLDEFGLRPGDVKENITTRGIRLMSLASSARLKIGSRVTIELTKSCAPCSRMEELRSGLQKDIAGKRGMLARVIVGGTIRSGDLVKLLPT